MKTAWGFINIERSRMVKPITFTPKCSCGKLKGKHRTMQLAKKAIAKHIADFHTEKIEKKEVAA